MKLSRAVRAFDETFSRKFTTPGTYTYFCSLHPRMVAKIVVQDAPAKTSAHQTTIPQPMRDPLSMPGRAGLPAGNLFPGAAATGAQVKLYLNGGTTVATRIYWVSGGMLNYVDDAGRVLTVAAAQLDVARTADESAKRVALSLRPAPR